MEMQQIEMAESGSDRRSALPAVAVPGPWDIDPLGADSVGDEVVVTTCRRLLRLSIAATDVGGSFVRRGIEHDPAAWMVTPRTLFDGRFPIDACQDLEGFKRNAILHGLALGIDSEPSRIDELLSDDDGEAEGVDDGYERNVIRFPVGRHRGLITCWVDVEEDGTRLLGFCALVTDDPAVMARRVIDRFGTGAAATADYRMGFDPTTALATTMLSTRMIDALRLAAVDPGSLSVHDLDIVVEHRFDA